MGMRKNINMGELNMMDGNGIRRRNAKRRDVNQHKNVRLVGIGSWYIGGFLK
jgi:hypothetical protein